MKTKKLRRTTRQLEADGRTAEAITLVLTESQATKTFAMPRGVLTVPDFARQVAALRVGLEMLKQRGNATPDRPVRAPHPVRLP